jgi:hypothetical protein
MTVELTDDVRRRLDLVGRSWPASDEAALRALGEACLRFAHTLGEQCGAADLAAAAVRAQAEGMTAEAFFEQWADRDSPAPVARDAALGVALLSFQLVAYAVHVEVLKKQIRTEVGVLALAEANGLDADQARQECAAAIDRRYDEAVTRLREV